ncbi:MAG: 50S ribosomal protein L10 [Candidatus Omnitrophica bacterium]|nr:50S ribosomal protein L10 [Candidatus Omnitrophota bacterium]
MPSELNTKMLKETVERLKGNSCIFFGVFKGLPVSDFSELRRSLEKVSGRSFVVKNTIASLALKEIGAKEADSLLGGSIFLTVGSKEPQDISKVLVKFLAGRDTVELRGVFLDGKVYQTQYVKTLAKLPSRKELLASLAGGIRAPLSRFVCTLNGVARAFVVTLNEIKNKKAQGSPEQSKTEASPEPSTPPPSDKVSEAKTGDQEKPAPAE